MRKKLEQRPKLHYIRIKLFSTELCGVDFKNKTYLGKMIFYYVQYFVPKFVIKKIFLVSFCHKGKFVFLESIGKKTNFLYSWLPNSIKKSLPHILTFLVLRT
jgi:hypothetical protein